MNLNHFAQQLTSSEWSKDTSGGAPVHLWTPEFCGDIPLKIKFDGTWTYMDSPIGRQKLVSLFASVLKREDDNYFLVTPVEKVGIQVEDVPFVITQWQQKPEGIAVSTQSGETFVLSSQHPVECRIPEGYQGPTDPVPYARVRQNLWARFHQNVFYQMVEHADCQPGQDHTVAVMQSKDYTFELGRF